jgi:ribonuclease HII
MSKPDYALESSFGGIVAGIDEAGRGPWAGPVVASAVILDIKALPSGINDSKKLSASKREALFEQIMATATVGLGVSSVGEIDEFNILGATKLAMQRALAALSIKPALALVDGNRAPKLPCAVQTIVKGDSKSLSIAAASIIAKVTRDRMMCELAAEFPGYGWERNAGYGTATHQQGLAALGITPHHRRSFAPIRALIEEIAA